MPSWSQAFDISILEVGLSCPDGLPLVQQEASLEHEDMKICTEREEMCACPLVIHLDLGQPIFFCANDNLLNKQPPWCCTPVC